VDIGGGAVELELAEGLEHRAGRGEGKEVGHSCLDLILEERVVHGGAQPGHHGEDLVAVDELGPRLHGARHLILRVLHDELDLAPVDAPLLVHLVEAHLHRVRRGDAVGGGGGGAIGVHAEHDLGGGVPARLREGGAGPHEGGDEKGVSQCLLHGGSFGEGGYTSTYMVSMTSLYLVLTKVRLSFMVGVSSSSSGVRICS